MTMPLWHSAVKISAGYAGLGDGHEHCDPVTGSRAAGDQLRGRHYQGGRPW
ncbi:hypothetical protein [Streptomyces sp. NPDC001948]